ncbi:MAG: DinB family protein [Bacteroidia bacterium]
MDKLNFLKTEFPKLVQNLNPEAKGSWGVMNGQQMVEHMADSVSQATGKNNQKLHTAPDLVGRYKDFAMSDKEFKPNTPNALLPDVPAPVTKSTMQEAINEYSNQIKAFINYFEINKDATITNPFFGDLNFEEWTHLLHKHAVHHSKQFGLL